jgi:hypothetical protein
LRGRQQRDDNARDTAQPGKKHEQNQAQWYPLPQFAFVTRLARAWRGAQQLLTAAERGPRRVWNKRASGAVVASTPNPAHDAEYDAFLVGQEKS